MYKKWLQYKLCKFTCIVHDTLSLLICYRNNSDCLVSIGMNLFTIMLEYDRWSLGKVIPLHKDGLCHHLLMVCYVTIEAIIINVHESEMHKMKEEHNMLNYIQTFPE